MPPFGGIKLALMPPGGEGKYIEIQEEIPSPSTGEGQGGGDFGNFFTASGRVKEGGCHFIYCVCISNGERASIVQEIPPSPPLSKGGKGGFRVIRSLIPKDSRRHVHLFRSFTIGRGRRFGIGGISWEQKGERVLVDIFSRFVQDVFKV